ncbi:MAG: 50S ribosomal protein L18, partial [Mycobacteriaceae bacterium]|nr:50S ribosomal protein L18 [Mycobacteriaceae bacterium]
MAPTQTATAHKPVGASASAARRVARLRRHARLRKK